jgi:D-alanyl-D-alanine endopeptidase (penicillin-binding protein 7)
MELNGGPPTLARAAAEPRAIASITKLMTAMVVLDEGQPLAQELDVGSDDVDTVKNTHSRLRRVATLTREELLTAALLSSDNMAALALARHSLGGRTAFVQKMNEKARALGLADTAFVDPAGLSPANRSTPQDLAKMVATASGYAFIRNTTTQRATLIHGLAYRNTNPWAADPLWGIQLSKTGFTNEAGRCIAVVMEVAGAQYSVVLLGAQSMRARARDLTAIRNWLHARHGSAAAALPVKAARWESEDTAPTEPASPAAPAAPVKTERPATVPTDAPAEVPTHVPTHVPAPVPASTPSGATAVDTPVPLQ